MGEQLARWQGQFGLDYQDRNPYEPRSAVPYFERVAHGREIESILEVGCNLGSKLGAWLTVLPNAQVRGIEPNASAAAKARAVPGVFQVIECDAYALPFADATFDLVFTSGVLMHVPPGEIARATNEIVRVAKKYVLAIEQYAMVEKEIETPYRGIAKMWWARHYGELYAAFPALKLLHHEPYREWYLSETYVWLFGKDGAQ